MSDATPFRDADPAIVVGDASKLRWGILGCGVIAHQMADALALQGRAPVGVANRTHDKAVDFARAYGIPKVYDDIADVFADPGVDAVYITTPHNTHIAYLRQALSAGKHVLCEKSITLNSSELDEACDLARKNRVVLMDAMTIFHMPLYRELRRRVDAGDFGRVNLVQLDFGSYKPYDMENRFFNPNLAGGALLDIGVYAISLARLFMESRPDEVVSLMNRCETGVDETSGIVMRDPQGQMATCTLSLHSKQPKRAVISCDKAYIEVMEYPRADEATIVWTDDGRSESVRAGSTELALAYEMADLESAVAGDARSLALIGLTRDVMHVMTDLRSDWDVTYPEERVRP